MRRESLSLCHKKRRGTQLIAIEVLVYRATISEPTPWSVSIDTYLPVAKITSFQWRDSKRMLQILFIWRIANL